MLDIKRHIRIFYSEYFAIIVAINLLTECFSLQRNGYKKIAQYTGIVINESILTVIKRITIYYVTVKLNFDHIRADYINIIIFDM